MQILSQKPCHILSRTGCKQASQTKVATCEAASDRPTDKSTNLHWLSTPHTNIKLIKQIPLQATSLKKSIMQESGLTVITCMPSKRSITSCSQEGMASILRSAIFNKNKFHQMIFESKDKLLKGLLFFQETK